METLHSPRTAARRSVVAAGIWSVPVIALASAAPATAASTVDTTTPDAGGGSTTTPTSPTPAPVAQPALVTASGAPSAQGAAGVLTIAPQTGKSIAAGETYRMVIELTEHPNKAPLVSFAVGSTTASYAVFQEPYKSGVYACSIVVNVPVAPGGSITLPWSFVWTGKRHGNDKATAYVYDSLGIKVYTLAF